MRRAICVPASLVPIVICGFVCFEPAWAGISPKLSISDVTVSDVSCTSQQAVFTVSVSAPFGKSATVQYATADGSAIAGTDYTAVSGTLSFPKGSKASHTITVPIADVLISGPNKIG